jgi:hypothetical protein
MDRLNSLLATSEKVLLHVKRNVDLAMEQQLLQAVTLTQLKTELNTDQAKKTFWINIYNAFYQLEASKATANRKTIFSAKVIRIGHNSFSLDDIEHGILRKNRWKWSFGYLRNPFASALLKDLEVQTIDFRIHFALNCGAKSCPPIAFYTFEKIEQQLDHAMYSFLEQETTVDHPTKIIATSKLMLWYRADFGGTKGIKQILTKVLEFDTTPYKIKYATYSWETHLENFV